MLTDIANLSPALAWIVIILVIGFVGAMCWLGGHAAGHASAIRARRKSLGFPQEARTAARGAEVHRTDWDGGMLWTGRKG